MNTVKADRHVILPHQPDWNQRPVAERVWRTGVDQALAGQEARAGVRQAAWRKLTLRFLPHNHIERARLEERIQEGMKLGLLAIPEVGVGAGLIDGADAGDEFVWLQREDHGIADGDYIVLVNPYSALFDRWDLTVCVAVSGRKLTLPQPLDYSYPAGTRVWPFLFGRPEISAWQFLNLGRSSVDVSVTNDGRPILPSAYDNFESYTAGDIGEDELNGAEGWAAAWEFGAFDYPPRELVVGGLFTRIDGALCTPNLEVLDALTGAVLTATPGSGFNGPVTAICVDEAAERIYVAGCFTEYNGAAVPDGLVRLDFDLAIDAAFNPPGFYVTATSPYPVPTQLFVSGDYVYAVASNTYTTFQKNVKDARVFGFPVDQFGTSLVDGAYFGPPVVRFAKTDGAIDTSWVTNEWVWNDATPANRWIVQAACAHTSGAIIVSSAQLSGGSAGSLLLLAASDCSTLHAIDSTIAFAGMQPGVAVDVVTLPNGSVVICHQDAASGVAWTFRDTSLDVFSPIAKQGAMLHVLEVVASKFTVDTGFTATSLWEFQVLGQDKYGLADIPYRLGKELLATSPLVTTLPYGPGSSDYYGKWGQAPAGDQIGMVFWHGDPYDSTRCWDISGGTYNGATWQNFGLYSEACSLGESWVDTVAAYPLATWPSTLESLDDGYVGAGVGVYIGGPVASFQNTLLKTLCETQTLSIDGGDIDQVDFQYYPFFKLTVLGEMDASFVHHLYEYQEADASQLVGLETEVAVRRYCGRVLCAALLPA